MIKFFRHIRLKLLAGNRLSQYLIYAVGEIVLVVIGILLALSINQWNQERTNLKKAEDYIERIVADIANDTITLKSYMEGQQPREQLFKDYFNYLEQGNINLAQLKDTLSAFKTITGFIEFTSTTYDQLVASGNFELIGDDKRIAIIEYYKFCGVFREIVDSYERSMRDESFEARKYLDLNETKYDFFKAINYTPSNAFIVQGLKHRHNRISLDQDKWSMIKLLGESYLKTAKATIDVLKQN